MDVLLGAGITLGVLMVTTLLNRIGVRADARTKAKQEAVDQLAEWVKYGWDKGNELGWINLQVYLSRLRGPLHRAGVPNSLSVDFRKEVEAMWNKVAWVPELEDGNPGWVAYNDAFDRAAAAADRIHAELERQPAWWRRALS